jgi:hypothetical protein
LEKEKTGVITREAAPRRLHLCQCHFVCKHRQLPLRRRLLQPLSCSSGGAVPRVFHPAHDSGWPAAASDDRSRSLRNIGFGVPLRLARAVETAHLQARRALVRLLVGCYPWVLHRREIARTANYGELTFQVHEAGHDHAYNALGCCGWQCFCCFCRW